MSSRTPSPATLGLALLALTLGCASNRAGPDDRAPAVVPAGETVDGHEVDEQPVVRVEELLQGRFPGVRVIAEPGGGFSVRVWGPATFEGGKDPLYVIDGVPINVAPGRGVDWLNPADIARIEVLKDISETAVWGSRGGNGVVVITTRRGHPDA